MKHYHHFDQFEHEPATRAARRAQRKKPTMKVSGASVKKLQKLIIERARLDKEE